MEEKIDIEKTLRNMENIADKQDRVDNDMYKKLDTLEMDIDNMNPRELIFMRQGVLSYALMCDEILFNNLKTNFLRTEEKLYYLNAVEKMKCELSRIDELLDETEFRDLIIGYF